jgi:hypothetical protein
MRPDTKHARIIAMLRAPAGTTVAAIMTATDWQQHSVRGFLAGVIRKKLGLNLVSEQADKGRVYRIKDRKAFPTKQLSSSQSPPGSTAAIIRVQMRKLLVRFERQVFSIAPL